MIILFIITAAICYQAGRISPDPLQAWEVTLQRRSREWRVWWIGEHIKKAEARRAMLLLAMKEDLAQ